jgi:hypothetical protein
VPWNDPTVVVQDIDSAEHENMVDIVDFADKADVDRVDYDFDVVVVAEAVVGNEVAGEDDNSVEDDSVAAAV